MPEAKNQPPKSPKSMVLWLVLLTAIANAGAFYYWSHKAPSVAGASQPAPSSLPAVLHLETFTLNIDDPEQRTYLRVGIDLGLDHDPKADKESSPPTAVVRDTILNVLMATKPQDVTTIEGKRKLKEQILVALQQRVPGLGVREIYFTEFLVQR
ncbi:MAG TPA: flagellar basal body-associated FliL family protein [Terriglobales bacterium]|nr:flagellar basal body-associated FliL family protein [Terriglobales bacterium]